MPSTEVSAVVDSILTAFRNGMDLFKRLQSKKKSRVSKEVLLSEDEMPIHNSLSNRPREIRHEYEKSVARLGRRFELGDGTAHNTLAHVLLVLNTGIMNLINHALHGDSRNRAASRHALYGLSESAAMETLNALSQLSVRLSYPPSTLNYPRSSPRDSKADSSRDARGLRSIRSSPSPLLDERGGWIRSRNGSSSSVSVVTPKKKSGSRPSRHERTQSEPLFIRNSPPQSPAPVTVSLTSTQSWPAVGLPLCECQTSTPHALSQSTTQNQQTNTYRPRRQPSMLIMSADVFETVHEESAVQLPVRPPKVPLHSRPQSEQIPSRSIIAENPITATVELETNQQPDFSSYQRYSRKPRPASLATFMTTSTKIGEIPEHKWPDRVLTPEEQARKPMPYTLPPMLVTEERVKRGRGFKFWKKDDKRQATKAY